ncbi:CobQ/CobB/MinD/ParA nucleotide-binding domain protein [Gregarina niphandrodes]|uniref:CobQ/CobB/MinD/ParA nucleotide-binding domain protein n=1 Tax=Gregarina niphandrodes TaxID=110365 RepID=A0A023AZL3_GRENI|nr:CobQ/CobB/MinD/ParA nucleotide-binding domain protein [Gregarina niphandrodes]EZG44284.1 CobQ/CobB/MinD/ParA nucleotide-binding domain protein [Gregarina niphandrodes]|eukprot:XP_011132735.1 CobQ/CobB/MinD/ParA nucleotide-binding domain protein [Gregarina niphandrodes]
MDEASDDDGHFGWSDRCLRDEVVVCLGHITDDGKDIIQHVRSLEILDKKKVKFMLDTVWPADTESFVRKCEEVLGRLDWIEEVEITVNPSVYGPGMGEDLDGIRSVILVTSCKGGVGKSTVAANLAVLLAQRGARVGICDLDIYGPSVPLLFPQISGPVLMEDGLLKPLVTSSVPLFYSKSSSCAVENHYNNVGAFPRRAFSSVFNKSPLFRLPLETPRPLKVMSSGFLRREHIAMKGPMACELAQQLLLNTAWGHLDYLVVDMPPGTGDLPLSIAEMVPSASYVLVTTPHDLSVADTLKGHQLFVEMGLDCVGLVINQMGTNRTGRINRQGALTTSVPTMDQAIHALRKNLGDDIPVCLMPNENQEMSIREFYFDEDTLPTENRPIGRNTPIGPITLAWYKGAGWTTSLMNLKEFVKHVVALISERKECVGDKSPLPSVVFESCYEMVVNLGSKSCRLSAMKLRRACKCADCVVELPKFAAEDVTLKSIVSVTPKGIHLEFHDGHKAYLRFEHVLPEDMLTPNPEQCSQASSAVLPGPQADW